MKYDFLSLLRDYDFKTTEKDTFIKLAFIWEHDDELKDAKTLGEFLKRLYEISYLKS